MRRMKVCRECSKSKPLTEFSNLTASPDGLAYYCKECIKERNRAAYLANAEARKAYQRAYNAGNRKRAAAAKKAHYERNKAAILARQREYYAENAEARIAYARAWRVANPDYAKNYSKKYAKENAERVAAMGKKYRDANKEKIAEYQRKYHESHPEVRKTNDRKRKLAKYGLTRMQFEEMLDDQGRSCLICAVVAGGKQFAVDHEHVAGYAQMPPERRRAHIRGLLCDRCNKLLGHFKESAAVLRAAAAYLRAHRSSAAA